MFKHRKCFMIGFIICIYFIVSAIPAFARAGADAKLESGIYALIVNNTKTKALSVKGGSRKSGAGFYTLKQKGKAYQVFRIQNLGNGQYTINNVRSGMNLSIKGKKKSKNNNIQQVAATNKTRQKWYISKVNGAYVVESCYGSKALTVKNSSKKSKAKVYCTKYSGKAGQRWKIIRYQEKSSTSGSTSSKATSSKSSVRLWNDSIDFPILTNIIGAIESGGQIYGNRDYGCYEDPYANSPIEHTITIGWAQFFGEEAQTLIKNIVASNPSGYKKIDPKGLIKTALKKDWYATRYAPTPVEKGIIKKLIVTDIGKKLQDKQFQEQTKPFIDACKQKYTSEAPAIHMYCQIRHLGGLGAVNKIFDKCKGNYSCINILKALAEDKLDASSNNQVGDAKFDKRHQKVVEFITKYVLS